MNIQQEEVLDIDMEGWEHTPVGVVYTHGSTPVLWCAVCVVVVRLKQVGGFE